MSQKTEILEALKSGERLTWLNILQRFRCSTGAQRISELRAAGHTIHDQLVPNSDGKKRIAEYWMEPTS